MEAPDGHLLPNLRDFTWTYSEKCLLLFIDLFLGPNINLFAIGPIQDNAHYSVLAKIAHRYPALSGVGIAHLDPDLYGLHELFQPPNDDRKTMTTTVETLQPKRIWNHGPPTSIFLHLYVH
jgi:hypothetical protein